MRQKALTALLLCPFACFAGHAQTEQHNHNGGGAGARVVTLPRDLELRLAVNALPPVLRDEATVRVMEPGGYIEAKHGSSPFTCIVSRRAGNFYPVCFDREGARTIMPAYEDDAIMRLKGMSDAEVEAVLAQGFQSGKYRPPAGPGIAYMLSPLEFMYEAGKFHRAPPHTMFYAPFLTDANVSGIPGKTPFIDRPGPHGQFIVVAGKEEREKIFADNKDLIAEVEKALGPDSIAK